MRAREIIQEDYNQSLDSDLNNILVSAKGSGATELKTRNIVHQLHGMGYAVDINSIMSLLSNNPMIQNATPDTISMIASDGASANRNPEDSGDHVASLAKNAVKKSINK